MNIRINCTIKEIREQGVLDKFCELFNYNPATIKDDQNVSMNLAQANKIGLQVDLGETPKVEQSKKRTKKAK